jgi:AcrR family transcriptional regulator
MSKRDAEGKRQQLLMAGLSEFAAHGIAGARVDRIAKLAGCSAGLVYTYFTSKDELFEAVFDTIVEQSVTQAPITADDLPAYAGKLFDTNMAHPEVARLVTWYRLERPGNTRPAVLEATKANVEAIRVAQQAGEVSTRLDAEQVLYLILQLAAHGSIDSTDGLIDRPAQRAAIVEAVKRLIDP